MIFCLQAADLLTVDKTQLFFSNKRKDAFYSKTMTFAKVIYSNEFVSMNGVFFELDDAFRNKNAVAIFEEKIREMYDNELKSHFTSSSNAAGDNYNYYNNYMGGAGGGGQRSTMMWRKTWRYISFSNDGYGCGAALAADHDDARNGDDTYDHDCDDDDGKNNKVFSMLNGDDDERDDDENRKRKTILKISGIWENDTHYGCSYKLFHCSRLNGICVKK